jgi:hypothetical protein
MRIGLENLRLQALRKGLVLSRLEAVDLLEVFL